MKNIKKTGVLSGLVILALLLCCCSKKETEVIPAATGVAKEQEVKQPDGIEAKSEESANRAESEAAEETPVGAASEGGTDAADDATDDTVSEDKSGAANRVYSATVVSGDITTDEEKYPADLYPDMPEVSYDTLELSEDYRSDFPLLGAAIDSFNADEVAGIEGTYEQLASIYVDALADPEYPVYAPYADQETITVNRADATVLSFCVNWYMFAGGVHGTYGVYGYAFDAETGRQLELKDALSSTWSKETDILTAISSIVADKLVTEHGEEIFYSDSFTDDITAQFLDGRQKWILGDDGITFSFDPYEIGSYAAGLIQVKLQFTDYPELFDEKYK